MQTIEEMKQDSLYPVIVADHQGMVVDVNSHFEQVFGWKRDEICGQLLTVILPVYFRDSHHLGFSRFAATGTSAILNHPLKLKALTKDRQEILSEHFIIAEQRDGNWVFAATLRPLSGEDSE
ncbi:MAG TPA: PAS domain S-box protein [Chroococcidiopsis sp.]